MFVSASVAVGARLPLHAHVCLVINMLHTQQANNSDTGLQWHSVFVKRNFKETVIATYIETKN